MPVGRSEDRAMQGCNPSAAPEAGAGPAWKHALPLSLEIMKSEGDGDEQSAKRNRQSVGGGKI